MATSSSGAQDDLPPFRPFPQKGPSVTLQRRDDGSMILESDHDPAEAARTVGHLFLEAAREHPDRPFLMQREPGHGPWRGVTYAEAERQARGIAQWLLDRGMSPDDCVLVLSGNSVEHGVLMIGCYLAGVPIAPISQGYSLLSTDHEKLKHCFSMVRPKTVFVQDSAMFAKAIETLRGQGEQFEIISVDGGEGTVPFADMAGTEPTPAVEEALNSISPDDTGKYLFTSGSTGMPKCVPQLHRMMTGVVAAGEGLRLLDEEEDDEPPQSLEWMPWSHISAGNIAFNGNLAAGGTVYLDEGKPLPGMFETTIKNLYDISPRVFGSAPVAFGMLADAMERDRKLRASFFKNLIYMGYGGATLSNDLYERMQALAIAETGERIPMVTMYGATETQGITTVHWATDRVGLIGLPLPGTTLKLVPNGDKLEVRVKGPTVTTGYHRDAKKTQDAFDEEGFYKLGDAAKFIDPDAPEKGLVFDGRVTEDFKLDTGTWVSVGTLRPDLVAACSPLIFDAVITGQDKPFIGAMVWPSAAAMEKYGEEYGADALSALRRDIAERLRSHNASAGGSSRRIGRFTVLTEPPSLDTGELTDKGYVNQRQALSRRAETVDRLYASTPEDDVVDLNGNS
ncbi:MULTISPECIES: AMP-binding protein [Pacificimonas]|nr:MULTISPECIES: AMP-binding protein [Pacificimonas]MBZ6378360.1 AMP-binding protein [Pacificimonas aurantium]